MKFIHSLGFLFIGSVMFLLPQFVPGLCPPDMFGYSIRETWLHVMGLTQVVLGSSLLVRKAGAELAAWLERWPELLEAQPSAPEFDPVPQAGSPVYAFRKNAPAVGEIIPVDFKPAWSGKQAA
jgi:hypothetical protein